MSLIKRSIKTCFLAGFLALFLVQSAAWAEVSHISDSFKADGEIYIGSIVSLKSEKPGYVEEATLANANNVLGVSTSATKSILSINEPDSPVKVAISGAVTVLVSDLNGPIDAGDQVVVSPIGGVGMKEEPGGMAVGIARTSFSATSESLQKRTIKDKNGQEKEVNIGQLEISIVVGKVESSNQTSEEAKGLAGAISSFANSIVGKKVAPVRLVLSIIIALLALSSIVVLIYGSIKSAITATGRNPLAKPVIFESLAQVMAMVALIAIIGIIIIYLILYI